MDLLTGQKLLRKTGEVIPADQALDRKRIILYYFGANWCPPSAVFTPLLVDFYQELVREDEPIEVVYVGDDDSPEELMSCMQDGHGDWLAVQHGAILGSRYRVTGTPTVIVVGGEGGEIVSSSGRSEICEISRGGGNCATTMGVFHNWLTAAKSYSVD